MSVSAYDDLWFSCKFASPLFSSSDAIRLGDAYSEHFFHLLVLNQWIILCKFVFLQLMEVERAIVLLRVAMFRAKDVPAPARSLDKTNFATTFPALV